MKNHWCTKLVNLRAKRMLPSRCIVFSGLVSEKSAKSMWSSQYGHGREYGHGVWTSNPVVINCDSGSHYFDIHIFTFYITPHTGAKWSTAQY